MSRITYAVEAPEQAAPEVQRVNLAFAAAAAARAPWTSTERGEYYWDFEALDDGAPAGAAHGDYGLNGSFFAGGGRPAALSAAELRVSGSGLGSGSATCPPGGPGIHDIPRNSVLFRTHASQQTMTSSLPPTEPNAPSAIQVAAVMEERKSRVLLGLPEDMPMSGQGALLRSASFGASMLRGTADGGAGNYTDAGSTAAFAGSPQTTSFASPFVIVNTTSALGALSSSGMVDDRTADLELDPPDGEGERDGCLVLPVLRTLLALQQDDPVKLAPRHTTQAPLTGQPHSPIHGRVQSHPPGYGTALTHTGVSFVGVSGGGGSGGGSSGVSRQASMHAIRATVPSAANGGGGLMRQNTLTSNSSPARRRVAAGEPGVAAKHAPPRRQHSTLRPIASYPMTHTTGGGATSPAEDDDPFGLGALEPALEPASRALSYSVAASSISPSLSFVHPTNSRIAKRTSTGLGYTPPPGFGGGAAVATAAAADGGGGSVHGGTAHGGTARTAGGNARGGTTSTKHQQQLQQQLQQHQHQPQPPMQPPPQQQQKSGGTKSGRALFAWTHKLSKGKWPWFPGGNAAANAATANSPAAASPAATGAGAASGGGERAGQESGSVHGASAYGLLGPSSDGGGALPAAALRTSGSGVRRSVSGVGRSISGNGRVSGNDRISGNGRASNVDRSGGRSPQGPLSPVGRRDSLQLPPIEQLRRKPTGVSGGSGGFGGGGGYPLGSPGGGEPGSPHIGLRSGGIVGSPLHPPVKR